MEKAVRRLISEEKISLNFSEKILSSDFFDPFSVKTKSAWRFAPCGFSSLD